jgi:Na+/H+ antiporter NhaC
VLLGIIVALVNLSGGSAAFGRWAEKNIKSRVGAMLATFVLGILIFIDDYFNCLTVGSVMRPVTDSHKVSRAKLAYLIDATAAPVCMIAPVSSWAAAVSATADKLDTGISGIQLFIRAIPYNFYSLLTFVFIIAIVLMKFDYGPMKMHEMAALLEGKWADRRAPMRPRESQGAGARPHSPGRRLIICSTSACSTSAASSHRLVGRHRLRRRLHRRLRNTDAFVACPGAPSSR